MGAAPAGARVLAVGPGQTYDSPSAALKDANQGDTVEIAPGEYFDCIRVRAENVTVQGSGPGVVLTDQICDGKALIVVQAGNVALRNLSLARARAADGNGAGIRAEGRNLTIDQVQFANSQSGLMAADMPGSTITIRDSTFTGTGICDANKCGNSLTIGRIERLLVERTTIAGNRGGHQVVSLAALTELRHDTLEDGADGSASFEVMVPSGGSLIMEDCTVQKGPHAAGLRAAVLLDGHVTAPMVFRRNHYADDTGKSVPFILDWSDAAPVLEGNVVPRGNSEVSSAGVLAHRTRDTLADLKAEARGLAGDVLRTAKSLLGH